ncbi:MAG: c-type cytochrome, partial [Pirellulales bacterium]
SDEVAEAVQTLRSSESASNGRLDGPIDQLLSSPSAALQLMRAVADEDFSPGVREVVLARAAKSPTADVRDLFERFLPEEQRVQRLGSVVKPEELLNMPGDAERGRKLFFEASGVQCRNCHRIGGVGTEVGPDLDQIGKKYDRPQILDNILSPSNRIEQKYLTYVVETKEGQVHTGLLVAQDGEKVVLKDAENKLIVVPAADVELMVPQQKSLMPDLLLRDLTAEQVADLMALLSSLK